MRFLREQQQLNQVERWKLERHPLDVRQAIIDRYAREGPEAIAAVPGEQERLKWVGLYPQRQGGDAFMVRIKVPGGRLTAEQARTIGELASAHARGPWPPRAGDGEAGFNLLVGGGLSDGPRMASDLDVFVRPEQAVELTRAIAQLFGELGDRENRWTCRMRYLVQELGPEHFRAELQARAAFPLTPEGTALT